LPTGGCGMNET